MLRNVYHYSLPAVSPFWLFVALLVTSSQVTSSPVTSSTVSKGDKVDVFSRGEAGYFCIKIPYLIRARNNTLIALAEGRRDSCSDYAPTDLVYKRSLDEGVNWSPLKVLRSNSSSESSNVIGNAAPVQCRVTGRILVPHCRNNKEVWTMFSEDDGVTWSVPAGPFPQLVRPGWKWIGLGPPAGLQLRTNNRIVIPSYHSEAHIEGDISKGHFIYSDDYGETWLLSPGIFGLGPNASLFRFFPSESQAVQLMNGSILVNSRGDSQYRVGSVSHDSGDTFEESFFLADLRDQLTGCEGSMISSSEGGTAVDEGSQRLYYSGLTPSYLPVLRYNMSIFRSTDQGSSWQMLQTVDSWSSSYSAMVIMQPVNQRTDDDHRDVTSMTSLATMQPANQRTDEDHSHVTSMTSSEATVTEDRVGILYERSRELTPIFVPDQITFQTFTFNT